MTYEEEEKARRQHIVDGVKAFDAFLKSARFTKDDIVMLCKTFEVWRKNLSRAKKMERE
jgi:hypothetical protein